MVRVAQLLTNTIKQSADSYEKTQKHKKPTTTCVLRPKAIDFGFSCNPVKPSRTTYQSGLLVFVFLGAYHLVLTFENCHSQWTYPHPLVDWALGLDALEDPGPNP